MRGAGATASAVGARPVSTAALLASARQMVVVTTAGWDTVGGTLYAFDWSADGSWTPARWGAGAPRDAASRGVAIVVGKNGTAWDPGVVPPVKGPIKAEGDGRSPAGVFALGTAFGFARAADATWLSLPYTEVTPTLECVDDPASGHYNTLADRATAEVDWKSSEKMRGDRARYHWGVVVEYNTRPVVPRRGSCIFLHIGGEGGRGHGRLHGDGGARAQVRAAVADPRARARPRAAPARGLRHAAHRVGPAGPPRGALIACPLAAPSPAQPLAASAT